jgi:hypothetical protein
MGVLYKNVNIRLRAESEIRACEEKLKGLFNGAMDA